MHLEEDSTTHDFEVCNHVGNQIFVTRHPLNNWKLQRPGLKSLQIASRAPIKCATEASIYVKFFFVGSTPCYSKCMNIWDRHLEFPVAAFSRRCSFLLELWNTLPLTEWKYFLYEKEKLLDFFLNCFLLFKTHKLKTFYRKN